MWFSNRTCRRENGRGQATTKRTARSTSAKRGRRHRRPLQAFGEVERIADERAGWRTTLLVAWDATTSWPVVQDPALRARGDDRMGNVLDPTLRGTPITVSIAHFVEREDDHERIARHGRIIPPTVGLR